MIVLLLLLLWLPLLVFSSGAPTYQTPTLLDVRVNASLTQVSMKGERGGGHKMDETIGAQWESFIPNQPLYGPICFPPISKDTFSSSLSPQALPSRGSGPESFSSFPLYTGGSRRTLQGWADPTDSSDDDGGAGLDAAPPPPPLLPPPDSRNGGDSMSAAGGYAAATSVGGSAPLPPGLADYSRDQIKLVCLAQVGGYVVVWG